MSTNKIELRTVEQFMTGYTPVYKPIYPLFLPKSQQWSQEVGKLDFRRVQTVGDIRAKHITPKDTEIAQVGVKTGKKSFKKYFLANQFTISSIQSREGAEEVAAEVLDEHQIQMDELMLLGEGTSASTMLNNGLFWSDDTNYTLEASSEIDSTDRLYDFHNQVLVTAQKADQVAGRKVIFFYGADLLPYFNSVYETAVKPFKVALQEVLGSNFSFVQVPSAPTPSSANGWIVANLDQVKMHYTALPQLLDQGNNTEKMYLWFNFMMGSCMLECLAKDAIVRQPITLEA